MLAINQLCAERKLSREVVLEAVEAALISAYKRNFGAAANIEVSIDPATGEVSVYAIKDVVEEVEDPKLQISLEDARRVDSEAELETTVRFESTPRDFGRIAAQTAKQVILQRIREAERDAQYASYADREGDIAHGTIQSKDFHSQDVIINLDGAEALLPAREQVPNERYRRGTRLRAYVLDVRRGNRGAQITLSRRTPNFLRRLLELEVPEVFNGTVEIKAIAREAGSRSKVAVHATQEGVDPVGSCVGVRGGRIQNVVNELGGEKIDVVQWDPDVGTFIANALSPAKVMNVLLDDSPESGKTGTVIVPDRQLSLAIGKEGQNARLAAKLTGWRIDIKSVTEAAEETLGRLEDTDMAPEDMDLLTLAEVLLRKREAEGLTDEDQSLISATVEETFEEVVDWPEEEPELEEEPETRAAVEEEEAAEEELAGEAEAELEAEAEAEPVAGAEAEEIVDEEDLPLPFEGQDIEDSLGWVITQTEEDYYDGWDDEDEDQEYWDEEPDIDKLLEEEAGTDKDRKKKKKKKGRRSQDRGRRYDNWK
ncbi:MAG: transcription termination factor NusA [Anaerolineae bacterium]|jgi:N utilization substance protein A